MTDTLLDDAEARARKRSEARRLLDSTGGSIGRALAEVLHRELASMPGSNYPFLAQKDKQACLDRVASSIEDLVYLAVTRIAVQNYSFIPCTIESVTVKDEAKATVAVPKGSEALHDLVDHASGKATIVFCDPKEFTLGARELRAEADQRELELPEPESPVGELVPEASGAPEVIEGFDANGSPVSEEVVLETRADDERVAELEAQHDAMVADAEVAAAEAADAADEEREAVAVA